ALSKCSRVRSPDRRPALSSTANEVRPARVPRKARADAIASCEGNGASGVPRPSPPHSKAARARCAAAAVLGKRNPCAGHAPCAAGAPIAASQAGLTQTRQRKRRAGGSTIALAYVTAPGTAAAPGRDPSSAAAPPTSCVVVLAASRKTSLPRVARYQRAVTGGELAAPWAIRADRRTRPGPRLRAESATRGSTVTLSSALAEPGTSERTTRTRSLRCGAGAAIS